MILHWVLYLVLLALMLACLFITLMNLPGLWIMFLAAAAYMWGTRWAYLGWKALITLGLIALIAEILEFFASTAGAKRAGAGRGGLWGAVIGGIAGAIFFTGLIPIPIVGTIFGVCFGTFLGAIFGELGGGNKVGQSLRVGVGAAKGRFLGTMSKIMFGIVMLLITMWTALPIRASKPANASTVAHPAAATMPTTAPTAPR